MFNQLGEARDSDQEEETKLLFSKQHGIPSGRYMPESPHFGNELKTNRNGFAFGNTSTAISRTVSEPKQQLRILSLIHI